MLCKEKPGGKRSSPRSVLWLGLLWKRGELSPLTLAQVELTRRQTGFGMQHPLYIPLVLEGCAWEGGMLLVSFSPALELQNDGRFMDFFISSNNLGISILRGLLLLIFSPLTA